MMSKNYILCRSTAVAAALGILVWSCTPSARKGDAVFEMLDANRTGLDFRNDLKADSIQNVFNYMYFYNGGGVCAADFNNDGFTDLFFTANQSDNHLYINRGDLVFEEVTASAGIVQGLGWSTGATSADVNGDGLPDLYVSQVSGILGLTGTNQLFINLGSNAEGVPEFREAAAAYGLDLTGLCTQAGFFDYDGDGDLDLFQLRHSLHDNSTYGKRDEMLRQFSDRSGDQLLRNDGGRFTDVSSEAGIFSSVIGYGLGLAFGDIDLNGYPDLYVGNDFHENDYLYLNQGDGTFRESLDESIRHTSRFSMGVDIGDLNNDLWPEIISLDMHPEDPKILKSAMGEDAYNVFEFKLSYGYSVQFARNALQFNNGDGTFSEIGLMAGVYATDWSWAPLFLDFDNDGYKDLFISNGIPKRMNDIDYIKFISAAEIQRRLDENILKPEDLELAEAMPEIKLYNKFYSNDGTGVRMTDLSDRIRGHRTSYSNGAACVDLDNDGDLDLVVNNIGDEPFVYQNLSHERSGKNRKDWLQVEFQGPIGNSDGIGARVLAFRKNDIISAEFFPTRGFQSCMSDRLHLGLGDSSEVDSILLVWPDRRYQWLDPSVRNTRYLAEWSESLPILKPGQIALMAGRGRDLEIERYEQGPGFRHVENTFIEFNREPLMPHMVSREGPAMAVADVNGDRLEDVFFGGAKLQPSRIYLQLEDGTFGLQQDRVIAADSLCEDVDAAFADVDADGDLDLIVVTGGNEFQGEAAPRQPRLYLNDGAGNWTYKKNAFEGVFLTGACVAVHDFTGDGLPDLFIGGRAEPRQYGTVPRSFLLENTGRGVFRDVTADWCTDLLTPGLIKDAAWGDFDGDGADDLVLAAEWSSVMIFKRVANSFEKVVIPATEGMWGVVLPWDYDGDGDLDLLAGNLGENTKLKPTAAHPVRMLYEDFDANGSREQILLYECGGVEIPFASHMDLIRQIPEIKRSWLSATDFASASVTDLFSADKLASAQEVRMTTSANMLLVNTGEGLAFESTPLPDALQIAPIGAASLHDQDGDGLQEVLLGGNFYPAHVELGRYDASYGAYWDPSSGVVRTLGIPGEIRHIEKIIIGGTTRWIVARNDSEEVIVTLSE